MNTSRQGLVPLLFAFVPPAKRGSWVLNPWVGFWRWLEQGEGMSCCS